MKTLTKSISSFISIILFVSGGFSKKYDELPKAEQVFGWYIESTGGTAAYNKIKNRVTKSTLEILNQGIKLNLISNQEKPNKLYLVSESDAIGKIETGTNCPAFLWVVQFEYLPSSIYFRHQKARDFSFAIISSQ